MADSPATMEDPSLDRLPATRLHLWAMADRRVPADMVAASSPLMPNNGANRLPGKTSTTDLVAISPR